MFLFRVTSASGHADDFFPLRFLPSFAYASESTTTAAAATGAAAATAAHCFIFNRSILFLSVGTLHIGQNEKKRGSHG